MSEISPFIYLTSVTTKVPAPEIGPEYSQYVINKGVTFKFPEYTEFINSTVNRYRLFTDSNDMHYHFLFTSLPKRTGYGGQWISKKNKRTIESGVQTEAKQQEDADIAFLSEQMSLSKRDIRLLMELSGKKVKISLEPPKNKPKSKCEQKDASKTIRR